MLGVLIPGSSPLHIAVDVVLATSVTPANPKLTLLHLKKSNDTGMGPTFVSVSLVSDKGGPESHLHLA